jgi:hypothetical protein
MPGSIVERRYLNMCIRLGSDAGQNFLSTKDPVRKNPAKENDRKPLRQGNDMGVSMMLRRFFPASGVGE